MATPEQAQAPLNGAYYGPSVPPTQPRYKRRRSCCILSTFLKVIITIVVALGIAALVFWLVVRPTKIKFYVVKADLKQFDLNTNINTLNYNLDLTMVSRNPNRRVGIYYDSFDATVSYKGNRLSWVGLPRFYQGHKNTTTLNTSFRGQSVIVNRFEIDTFRRERNNGVFYIDVKIYARMRFKVGAIKTRRTKPEIECDLRIPLAASNGTVNLGRRFETTRCDIDF